MYEGDRRESSVSPFPLSASSTGQAFFGATVGARSAGAAAPASSQPVAAPDFADIVEDVELIVVEDDEQQTMSPSPPPRIESITSPPPADGERRIYDDDDYGADEDDVANADRAADAPDYLADPLQWLDDDDDVPVDIDDDALGGEPTTPTPLDSVSAEHRRMSAEHRRMSAEHRRMSADVVKQQQQSHRPSFSVDAAEAVDEAAEADDFVAQLMPTKPRTGRDAILINPRARWSHAIARVIDRLREEVRKGYLSTLLSHSRMALVILLKYFPIKKRP